MEFIPLGDSALLIRLGDDLEKLAPRSFENILGALQRLEAAQISGVVDLTLSYATIAVFFDPGRVVEAGAPVGNLVDWLTAKIQGALQKGSKRKQKKIESRLVEIPVCYEQEFGLDLDEVAQRAAISIKELIQLHTAPEYRVACVGFTPGFGFLSGLDQKLATPRREAPRTAVPAGSVAIGGIQTGVYPIRSPGGWNVIGRTALRMFDLQRDPPALLSAGDRVRFHSITRAEFDSLGK